MLPLMANTPIIFLNMNLYISYFTREFDLNTPIVLLILDLFLTVCEGNKKFASSSCCYLRTLVFVIYSIGRWKCFSTVKYLCSVLKK